MKNILVVGILHTGNLGDDLIYEMVFQTCKRALNKDPLTLNIGNTRKEKDREKTEGKKALLKKVKNKCSCLLIYKKYVEIKRLRSLNIMLNKFDFSTIDTIVFAGGQIFFNYFIPLIEEIVKKAERNSVKVIFNACGVGSISRRNAKKLRYVINNPTVKMITVRESPQLLLNAVGDVRRTDIYRVNDPAVQCASYYGQYTFNCNDSKKVGIGLIDPIILRKHGLKLNKSEYESMIKTIVSYCDKNHFDYEFFCTGDKQDYAFLCEIQKNIYRNSFVAERPDCVEKLLRLINRYDNIISFRLHSHIVATSYGIPSFALVWDKKVKEFFKGIGREQDCYDLTTGESLEKLNQKLDIFFHEKYCVNLTNFKNSNDVLYMKLSQINPGKEKRT